MISYILIKRMLLSVLGFFPLFLPAACKNKIGDPKFHPPVASTAKPGPLTPASPLQSGDGAGTVKMATELQTVSLTEFVYPLVSGYNNTRSMWCQCRSIGTSPHIGQDIVADKTLVAVANSESKVTKITYDGACGYAVWLQDPNGALWRYLHLDKPLVTQGQSLATGQKIATLGDYPQGCGTGPHLHLERRSASRAVADDREKGKSCGNGHNSCYFDPNIIAVARKLDSATESLSLIEADSSGFLGGSNRHLAEAYSSLNASNSDPRTGCEDPIGVATRRVAEQELPVAAERFVVGQTGTPLLVSAAFGSLTPGGRVIQSFKFHLDRTLSAQAGQQKVADESNVCSGSKDVDKEAECITEYRLVVSEDRIQWFVAYEKYGTRNAPLVITAESGACLPARARAFGILARTSFARTLFAAGNLD